MTRIGTTVFTVNGINTVAAEHTDNQMSSSTSLMDAGWPLQLEYLVDGFAKTSDILL